MSSIDYRSKRADKLKIRKLIVLIAQKLPWSITFSKHAFEEMKNDGLTTVDVHNILNSPDSSVLRDGELKNGSYRYQFGTRKIVIVVSLSPDGKSLTIVTAWRVGKG